MSNWRLNYLKIEDNVAVKAQLSAIDPDDGDVVQTDTNFPVSNMQILPVSKPGRITNWVAATDERMKLQIEFPAAESINVIALVGHNLSSTANIGILGGSSFDPSATLDTMSWRRNNMYHYFSSPQSNKYWVINIKDEANAYGFFQCGYLVMGTLTEIALGFAFGSEYIDEMYGLRRNTETGIPLNKHLSERTRLRLDFPAKNNSAINYLRQVFLDTLGLSEPALFIPNLAEKDMIFGRIDTDSFTRAKTTTSLMSVSVDLVDDPNSVVVQQSMPILHSASELPNGSSFTRATVANYKNANLQLVEAASGELRSDWTGVTSTGIPHHYSYSNYGTLIEPARTNGWTYSEDLGEDTAWTKTNCTISPNSVNEPKDSPSTLADKIIEASDSNQEHNISRDAPALTDNLQQAVSFFATSGGGGRDYVWIRTTNKAGTQIISFVNLSTGAKGTTGHGDLLVENYTNSWYRIFAHFDASAGGTTPSVDIGLSNTDNDTDYDGDGSSFIVVWGLQFEVDEPYASSYIATGVATATRNADVLYVPFDFDVQALSLYTKFIHLSNTGGSADEGIAKIGAGDAGSDPRFHLRKDVGGEFLEVLFDDGTTGITRTGTNAVSVGDTVESLGLIHPDGGAALDYSINGATVVQIAKSGSNILGAAFAADRLYLGSQGTAATTYPILIESLKSYRGVQSMAFMRQL